MPDDSKPVRSHVIVRPASSVRGIVRIPGDKSVSHRYAMLAAVAEGKSGIAIACLKRLDGVLAGLGTTETAALRGRGSIIVVSEVLTKHPEYFDIGLKP